MSGMATMTTAARPRWAHPRCRPSSSPARAPWTRIPIRRSSSQSTRQRTFRAWRRTDTSCACGCCPLDVAAHLARDDEHYGVVHAAARNGARLGKRNSNSYTPQLIAKYATTNNSGMASYVSATLRMRLLPRRRSSSHKERDDEHFGHGVAHAVARNPRGSRLYFSSRIRREPRWRVCPENTILIHAQRKGTRARAFRGVAVSHWFRGDKSLFCPATDFNRSRQPTYTFKT